MATPPLPPGFVLESEAPTTGLPELPPGFELEGPPIQDMPTMSVRPAEFSELSGVTREERQRQITQMDAEQAARQASFDRTQQFGRAAGLTGRAMLKGLAAVPDIIVEPLTGLVNRLGEKGPNLSSLITGEQERYFPKQMSIGQGVDYLVDKVGGVTPQTSGERVYSDVVGGATGAVVPVGVGRQLMQSASPVAQGVGRVLAAQPGLQAASGAMGAGASSAVREGGGGTGAQVAAGLAGAIAPAAAPAVTKGAISGALARSVPEQRKQLAREAKDLGIELTPGQLSDSRFLKWTQSMLRSVPFTGAQGRYQQQVGQFNRALAREIGEDADAITPEVYAAAKDRQSAMFDELTARNALKVDDQLVRSLSNIADSAKVNKSVAEDVEAAIDALYAQATTGPGGVVIPGEAYQAFDSQLGNIIKNGGAPAHFLGNVQSAVRRAMDKSISPKDAMAWRELRREYGSRKAITPLVAKAEGGEIKPAQVMGAATSTRAGKEAMATGRRGNLGTLARVGQVMKEPQSSGTAERIFAGGALGGATYIDPVTGLLTTAAGNLLSRGLDSKSLARLMVAENPGLSMKTAEDIIRRSALPAAIVTEQQQ
jgi:hypothetical protein